MTVIRKIYVLDVARWCLIMTTWIERWLDSFIQHEEEGCGLLCQGFFVGRRSHQASRKLQREPEKEEACCTWSFLLNWRRL